jgi:C4-dicarboxylate-binding protein DctP
MKKCRFVVLLAVLAVLTAAPAVWAKTEFRLSNQFPASHHISKGLVVFAEKVKEYSGGSVECKIFDSAQLYKDSEIVSAIQDSLIETGLVGIYEWSGMLPIVDIFNMPFVFKDLTSIKKFLDAGAAELLDKELEPKGAKNIFWVDYGYLQFFNNKRPLTNPDDMKGLTMRSSNAADAETLQMLGAAPTVMSSSEMYMALQRGTMDGATTGMPAAVSRKINEVQKYLTISNYSTAQFVVQANVEWWESLSDGDREVILKAGRDAEEWIRDVIAESENEAQKTIEASGVQIHELTNDEYKAFQDATRPVWDAFAARTGDMGKKLLELVQGVN